MPDTTGTPESKQYAVRCMQKDTGTLELNPLPAPHRAHRRGAQFSVHCPHSIQNTSRVSPAYLESQSDTTMRLTQKLSTIMRQQIQLLRSLAALLVSVQPLMLAAISPRGNTSDKPSASPREKLSLDRGWRFHLGDASSPKAISISDSAPRLQKPVKPSAPSKLTSPTAPGEQSISPTTGRSNKSSSTSTTTT